MVVDLDQQRLSELYVVREVLAGLAGRLAAQHASESEIKAMRDAIERQSATRRDDLAAQIGVNRLFHEVIYRAARNRYLLQALASLESSLGLLPAATYAAPNRVAAAVVEHSKIVDAITHRNPASAEELSRQHVRAGEQIRLRGLSASASSVSSPGRPSSRGRATTRS